MISSPHLASPRLGVGDGAPAPVESTPGQIQGSLVVALELEVFRPGGLLGGIGGMLARPHLAARPLDTTLESTDTLRASTTGYRTERGVSYPPTIDRQLAVDRQLNLHPARPAAAASWGTLSLANTGRRYDALARSRNSDGRPLRVLVGRRRWDESRGIELDPPYAALTPLMTGVAQPWALSEGALSIPLRDASALLERPYQQSLYLGTGGYEGGSDLAGRRKPRARGGAAVAPIRDVSPVWVDRVAGILQVSDAPGIVLQVAEAGEQNQLLPAGQVTDLYMGSVAPGYWRWCSRPDGLFIQLGSPTTAQITADVVGHFPSGAQASTAGEIALLMLTEDLVLPLDALDRDSFLGLANALPWLAGDYWSGSDATTADAAVGMMLASLGAKLVPSRSGRLRAWPLRALPAGTRPAATYTTAELVDVQPSARLQQEGLYPPPYRWRIGCDRCHTVMTSDLDPDVAGDRQAFLAEEFRLATWFDPALARAYRAPLDPAVVPTRLLRQGDAQALADAQGALWGGAPRLYEAVLPLDLALRHEIGDPLVIAYPLDDLDAGRLGQVVGEQTDLRTATSRLKVLI